MFCCACTQTGKRFCFLLLLLRVSNAFVARASVGTNRSPCVPTFVSTGKPNWRIGLILATEQAIEDSDEWAAVPNELVVEDDIDDAMIHTEEDWLPDREVARRRKRNARIYAEKVASVSKSPPSSAPEAEEEEEDQRPKPTPYTDEEEELIAAMGGRTQPSKDTPRRREAGFLGDSTLEEICTDYSVPFCYIADVLCMWGVNPPIPPHMPLGDLVTGEQAFALLEAVHSLDVAALQDRYSNQCLLQVCLEWDIDVSEAFEMAMKEGWNLPMGVQTNLRVEQEDELIRVLGNQYVSFDDEDDDADGNINAEWEDDD